jgi:tetratricopeptide (TPR) repeat protein
MKVFLSHASEDENIAEQIHLALLDAGCTVFFDATSLPAADGYDARIRLALDESDLLIYLISRDSVASSRYVRSELKFAQEKWPHPKGFVLPVMVRDTPFDQIPNYLKAVTILRPEGSAPAEVAAEVIKMKKTAGALRWSGWLRPRVWVPAALVVAVALAWSLVSKPEPPVDDVGTNVRPAASVPGVRTDIINRLGSEQYKSIEALKAGRVGDAINLTDRNLAEIDKSLQAMGDDPDLFALRGYALKNMYQYSRNLLPDQKRNEYMAGARAAFERALAIDRDNASAHNGMGNVLMFERKFDAALKEHDKALKLTNGQYDAAKSDRELVMALKSGRIAPDF